jgi:arginase
MDLQLLLVPYDTGRRGWRMGAGPEHLLAAGLATRLRSRGHDVRVETIEDDPGEPPAEIRTAFELMRRLAVRVRQARAASRFPLVLSGNCNAAVGTLAGLTPARRAVFWFDAHGDLNTPDSTLTGFLDGTGLATALGRCWHALAATVPGAVPVPPDATFLLGARDLDPAEAEFLARSPVTLLGPDDVRSRLAPLLAERAFHDTVAYVHCDLDVLDPDGGRANPFPAPGGLSIADVTHAVEAIGRAVPLAAGAVAAYAPEYDADGRVGRAAFAAIDAMVGAAARDSE